jgi:hypothetical protein
VLLAVTAAVGLLFWFFSGPDIRFAYGNLLAAPLLVLAWCLNQADISPPFLHRRMLGALAAGLMLIHAAYLNRHTGMSGVLDAWPKLAAVSGDYATTRAGETVYLANENGECWWQRPCTPRLAPGLEIRQASHWTIFSILPEHTQ